MSARRLQLKGASLQELKAKVLADHGPDAKIVAAEKVTVGGIRGFFAREHYEVTVELPASAVRGQHALDQKARAGIAALLADAERTESRLHGKAPELHVSTHTDQFAVIMDNLTLNTARPTRLPKGARLEEPLPEGAGQAERPGAAAARPGWGRRRNDPKPPKDAAADSGGATANGPEAGAGAIEAPVTAAPVAEASAGVAAAGVAAAATTPASAATPAASAMPAPARADDSREAAGPANRAAGTGRRAAAGAPAAGAFEAEQAGHAGQDDEAGHAEQAGQADPVDPAGHTEQAGQAGRAATDPAVQRSHLTGHADAGAGSGFVVGAVLEDAQSPAVEAQPAAERARQPAVPVPLYGPGDLVLVIGQGDIALEAANSMAAAAPAVKGAPSEAADWISGGGNMVKMAGAHAADVRRPVQDRNSAIGARARGVERGQSVFVAFGLGQALTPPLEMLALLPALGADQIWLAVDAGRKAEDTDRWVQAVQRVVVPDGLAVTGTRHTGSPKTVNTLGVPVGWVDGAPSENAWL